MSVTVDFSEYDTAPTHHTSSDFKSVNILSGPAVQRSNSRPPAADFRRVRGALTEANTGE